MVKYKDQNIIYTLKFSGYMTKRQKFYLYPWSIFMILLGLICFTILMIYNEILSAVLSLILLSGLGLSLLFILVYELLSEKKLDKEILKWITDENLFETVVTPWEFSSTGNFTPHYKFGIDFEYNGESLRKISSHYSAFYKKIKGEEIKILYSPKYDEVMILDKD